jgi:hypothetical protein
MTLTADERRRFREMARGLRITDPDWYALHGPCRHRYGGLVRCSAAALSLAMVVVGAVTGLMLVVFGGIVLASGVLTSYVSSRPRSPHDWARS